MDMHWIDGVMRLNTAIVEAETRFNAQVASLVALAEQGQDTAKAEWLLTSYRTSLDLLRGMQVSMLGAVQSTDVSGTC